MIKIYALLEPYQSHTGKSYELHDFKIKANHCHLIKAKQISLLKIYITLTYFDLS